MGLVYTGHFLKILDPIDVLSQNNMESIFKMESLIFYHNSLLPQMRCKYSASDFSGPLHHLIFTWILMTSHYCP